MLEMELKLSNNWANMLAMEFDDSDAKKAEPRFAMDA
jgi:hypothetical protein